MWYVGWLDGNSIKRTSKPWVFYASDLDLAKEEMPEK